jgi:hypothetical protein
MLATDSDCRTKKPGTRQKERCIQVEHVEYRDDSNNPQHKTGELMQHARGRLDALTSPIFATFKRFGSDTSHRIFPPGFVTTRFAISHLANHDSQNCVGDASGDKAADDDGNCNYGPREKSLDTAHFFVGGEQNQWQ